MTDREQLAKDIPDVLPMPMPNKIIDARPKYGALLNKIASMLIENENKNIAEKASVIANYILQREAKVREITAQEILDYSDKEKRPHLDTYCKQYYAALACANSIIAQAREGK